ncbi:Protein CASP [Scomber scombrus]|uniref:Protein CASP n=1 Tax=Scomber scombrus TaxID=13677 RepID=A0AAV1NMU6_SCOSC
MAADVGSMFQYWKKFDLRRLQVSAILTFFSAYFSSVQSLISGGATAEQHSLCVLYGHTDRSGISTADSTDVYMQGAFYSAVFTLYYPLHAPPYLHVRKLLMRPLSLSSRT